jgi:cAMP-dependent protein kinase regulator
MKDDIDDWTRLTAESSRPSDIETVELLSTSTVFSRLPRQRLLELLSVMSEIELPPGTALFNEGDSGDDVYVVLQGDLDVVTNSREVAHFGSGQMVGEFGALVNSPRTATVKAASHTRLLRMDFANFLKALGENPLMALAVARQTVSRVTAADGPVMPFAPVSEPQPFPDSAPETLARIFLLRRTKLFGLLTPGLLAAIVDRLDETALSPGQQIVLQGEIGDRLFILKSGSVEVRRDETVVTHLGPGAVFGERAVLLDEPRNATVIAVSSGAVLSLSRDVVFQLLRENFDSVRGLISEIFQLYGHPYVKQPVEVHHSVSKASV